MTAADSTGGVEERAMFGPLFPLLAAFPTIETICTVLPAWHPWHLRPDRMRRDLGLAHVRDQIICVRRRDDTLSWVPGSVVVVAPPVEVRRYLVEEHDAWLEEHHAEEDVYAAGR